MRIKSFHKQFLLGSAALLLCSISSVATGFATPMAPLPAGRVSIGGYYDLDGITITNREIPAVVNRIGGVLSFAPVKGLSIGADLAAVQMDVASDNTKNPYIELFHGDYKFSAGGAIRLSTPLIKDIVGVSVLGKGTWFSSEEKKSGFSYGGIDVTAAAGPVFHIKKFGYIAFGPKFYYLMGENNGVTGTHAYSNINNLRGWLAIEYFPRSKEIAKYLPYISLEASGSPGLAINNRAPVQEFGFSCSFGIVSGPLYKKHKNDKWRP